jgi:hypothetical protein
MCSRLSYYLNNILLFAIYGHQPKHINIIYIQIIHNIHSNYTKCDCVRGFYPEFDGKGRKNAIAGQTANIMFSSSSGMLFNR